MAIRQLRRRAPAGERPLVALQGRLAGLLRPLLHQALGVEDGDAHRLAPGGPHRRHDRHRDGRPRCHGPRERQQRRWHGDRGQERASSPPWSAREQHGSSGLSPSAAGPPSQMQALRRPIERSCRARPRDRSQIRGADCHPRRDQKSPRLRSPHPPLGTHPHPSAIVRHRHQRRLRADAPDRLAIGRASQRDGAGRRQRARDHAVRAVAHRAARRWNLGSRLCRGGRRGLLPRGVGRGARAVRTTAATNWGAYRLVSRARSSPSRLCRSPQTWRSPSKVPCR